MTFSSVADRRAGIERHAGLLAERADRLQRAVQCGPASTCTVMMSAPALAKASR